MELREICSKCGTLQLIVNKFHCLCDDCNYKRLHGGKSKQEVYKDRHEKKENKKPSSKPKERNEDDKEDLVVFLKKTFSIKQISNKRANRHAQLKTVYKKIDHEREPICEGCGRNLPLSHSHLMSEYLRPDLYTNPDNIRLHCFGTYHSCHETWERGLIDEIKEMDDFKDNLEFIRVVAISEYNKIIANAQFRGVKL